MSQALYPTELRTHAKRLTYTPQGIHLTVADLRVDHSRNNHTYSDTGNSFLAHAKITPNI